MKNSKERKFSHVIVAMSTIQLWQHHQGFIQCVCVCVCLCVPVCVFVKGKGEVPHKKLLITR